MWAPVTKAVAVNPTTLAAQAEASIREPAQRDRDRVLAASSTWPTRAKLGNDYGKKVIDGTGPFQFVEWVPGDHVTVKRWDAYPGSMTPFFKNKGKAYLDGIRWRFIQEAASRALAIENGELDALHGPAPQDIDRLKKNGNLTVTQLGEESVWFIGLNFDQLEFGDVRVRQAVSHALDRNAIVEKLVFGYGTTAFGPLPTSDPTYYKAVDEVQPVRQGEVEVADDGGGMEGRERRHPREGREEVLVRARGHERVVLDPARGGDPGDAEGRRDGREGQRLRPGDALLEARRGRRLVHVQVPLAEPLRRLRRAHLLVGDPGSELGSREAPGARRRAQDSSSRRRRRGQLLAASRTVRWSARSNSRSCRSSPRRTSG